MYSVFDDYVESNHFPLVPLKDMDWLHSSEITYLSECSVEHAVPKVPTEEQ